MGKFFKHIAIVVFLLVFSQTPTLLAQGGYFNFESPYCQQVQNLIPELQIESARNFIALEKKENPKNCASYLLENYLDYLEFFVTENENIYLNHKTKEKERIEAIDKLLPISPYTLLSKAEIRVHWAILKLKSEDYLSAGLALKDAYSMLKKNQKLYPDFIPNFKILGWIEAITASVPDSYYWMVKMIGISPNLDMGNKKLEKFCTQADSTVPEFLKIEGVYSWSFINMHISKDKEKALKIAETHLSNSKQPLNLLMLATIYNTCGENEKVIRTAAAYRHNQGALNVFTLDYLMGQALIRKQAKEAEIFLLNFYEKFKGKTNVKSAAYYLAILYHLNGNKKQSVQYLQFTQNKGKAGSEQDKQAVREAERGLSNNLHLLKARLLFDGGYLDKAYEEISKAGQRIQNNVEEKVEILYRKARIFHSQGKTKNAIFLYQQTIQEGKDLNRYFAANSALQLGYIFEESNEIDKAILWYKQVLSNFPKNTEYKNSLEQKAKAGIVRCK